MQTSEREARPLLPAFQKEGKTGAFPILLTNGMSSLTANSRRRSPSLCFCLRIHKKPANRGRPIDGRLGVLRSDFGGLRFLRSFIHSCAKTPANRLPAGDFPAFSLFSPNPNCPPHSPSAILSSSKKPSLNSLPQENTATPKPKQNGANLQPFPREKPKRSQRRKNRPPILQTTPTFQPLLIVVSHSPIASQQRFSSLNDKAGLMRFL